ncbi:acyl-CoA thioesterase [Fibrobacterota bacterium]
MENGSHKVEIKVRYAETDAMRFVYYGNYFTYFEVARIAALEDLGYPYHKMEENRILIPVLSASAEFKRPSFFGDVLTIHTSKQRIGNTRVQFTYKVFCRENLIATGTTRHAFMNPDGKPIRPPEDIIRLFDQ